MPPPAPGTPGAGRFGWAEAEAATLKFRFLRRETRARSLCSCSRRLARVSFCRRRISPHSRGFRCRRRGRRYHETYGTHTYMPFASIPEAIEDFRAGRMLVVVDDEDRENEGDLTVAAEKITPEIINFMATHGRGLVCLALSEDRCDATATADDVAGEHVALRHRLLRSHRRPRRRDYGHLGRRPRADHSDGHRPREHGRTTLPGRATSSRCARATAASWSAPGRPKRRWTWRALAGLGPGGVICEIMNDDGTMSRVPQLEKFCERHGLKLISVADLIRYRLQTENFIRRKAEGKLIQRTSANFAPSPTHRASIRRSTWRWSTATSRIATSSRSGCTPIALSAMSSIRSIAIVPGWRMPRSKAIANEGAGVLVYLHESGPGLRIMPAEEEGTPRRLVSHGRNLQALHHPGRPAAAAVRERYSEHRSCPILVCARFAC